MEIVIDLLIIVLLLLLLLFFFFGVLDGSSFGGGSSRGRNSCNGGFHGMARLPAPEANVAVLLLAHRWIYRRRRLRRRANAVQNPIPGPRHAFPDTAVGVVAVRVLLRVGVVADALHVFGETLGVGVEAGVAGHCNRDGVVVMEGKARVEGEKEQNLMYPKAVR